MTKITRQFSDKERTLTEKNVKVRKRQLEELNEQFRINKIKQDFIITQRVYQDTVQEVEEKQEVQMFEQSIKMLESGITEDPDNKELIQTLEYNKENFERIKIDREFKRKWTPYLRAKTDKENEDVNEELRKDIKITEDVISIAEDQLKNGVVTRIPTGVN